MLDELLSPEACPIALEDGIRSPLVPLLACCSSPRLDLRRLIVASSALLCADTNTGGGAAPGEDAIGGGIGAAGVGLNAAGAGITGGVGACCGVGSGAGGSIGAGAGIAGILGEEHIIC